MSDQRAQAPGFYRHRISDITVTVLNDGMLGEGTGVLAGIDPAAASAALVAEFLPPEPCITINAFLLHTGGETVLIDTGWGDTMGARAGKLLSNMRQAGTGPDEVGRILLTHMHPDHIGGLLDATGAPAFSRARVLVPEADAAVFLDEQLAGRVPEEAKPVFARRAPSPQPTPDGSSASAGKRSS